MGFYLGPLMFLAVAVDVCVGSRSDCVSTLADLREAMKSAAKGDTVKICSGTYTEWQWTMDTEDVTLEAISPGKVVLSDQSYVTVRGSGNTVSGVVFKGKGPTNKPPIALEGRQNTVRDCVVEGHQAHRWVIIQGFNNTVQNCRFSNKTAVIYEGQKGGGQQLIKLKITQESYHHNILDNIFNNYEYGWNETNSDNGYETVQLQGGDDFTRFAALNTVRGNYFYRCNTEAEVISAKSSNNFFEENVFEEVQGGLTFRNGDYNTAIRNVWYGNNVKKTRGIRIICKHHIISNNWFWNLAEGALKVYAGNWNHNAAENITMTSNTMVDCDGAIRLGDTYEIPPVAPIVFINNTVFNRDGLSIIENYKPEVVYDFSAGNQFYGSNLGWTKEGLAPEGVIWEGQVPEGVVWAEQPALFLPSGKSVYDRVKCSAGPTWEQTC